jgi:hypothetical protein
MANELDELRAVGDDLLKNRDVEGPGVGTLAKSNECRDESLLKT